jgi:hypothetical protein
MNISQMLGVAEPTTNDGAAAEINEAEEKAIKIFPERVATYENYREAVAGAWLFHRLAKVHDDDEVRAMKQEFVAAKSALKKQASDLPGDLRTYKLRFPGPENGQLITEADRKSMGVSDTFNDQMWLPEGFEFPAAITAPKGRGGDSTPEPEPEPEPRATCKGHFESGKRAGEDCPAAAKAHGYCLRHQSQAADEWEPKAAPEPEPEPEPTHEGKIDERVRAIRALKEQGFSNDEIVALLG